MGSYRILQDRRAMYDEYEAEQREVEAKGKGKYQGKTKAQILCDENEAEQREFEWRCGKDGRKNQGKGKSKDDEGKGKSKDHGPDHGQPEHTGNEANDSNSI